MATPQQVRRRGRFGFILGTLVASVTFVAVAISADLKGVELNADDTTGDNKVTVAQGDSVTFNVRLTAEGAMNCGIPEADPEKGTIRTSYAIGAAPTNTISSDASSVSSTLLSVWSNGVVGGGGHCGSAHDGPKTIAVTIAANAATAPGTYNVPLAADGIVHSSTNLTPRLGGTSPATIEVTVTESGPSYMAIWQRPLQHASGASFQITDVKNGRVIPGKVTISDGTDAVTGDGASPPVVTIKVSGIACSETDTAPAQATEYADAGQSSAGTNLFRWDAEAQQWVYNLDTKALSLELNRCYKLEVSVDGAAADGYAVIRPVR